jgi:hypothetical protein
MILVEISRRVNNLAVYSELILKLASAPTFKLIGNSMIIGALEVCILFWQYYALRTHVLVQVISEALTMGDKSGVGQDLVLKLIKDILPAPPLVFFVILPTAISLNFRLVAYGEKMVNDNFDGTRGFAIDGGIKDATYVFSPCASDISNGRLVTYVLCRRRSRALCLLLTLLISTS